MYNGTDHCRLKEPVIMTIPACFSFLKKNFAFPSPAPRPVLFQLRPLSSYPARQNLKRSCRRSSRFTRRKSPLACCKGEAFLHDSYALQQKLPARIAVVTQERPVPPKEEPPQKTVTVLTISAAGDCTLGTDESFGYEGTFPASYDAANGDASVFLAGVASILP